MEMIKSLFPNHLHLRFSSRGSASGENSASAFKKSCLPFSESINYSFRYLQLESGMLDASEAQLCQENCPQSKSS